MVFPTPQVMVAALVLMVVPTQKHYIVLLERDNLSLPFALDIVLNEVTPANTHFSHFSPGFKGPAIIVAVD
jgi:hypothetical protein